MVIDGMVASGQLNEDLRAKVREAMLKKHHHQNERKLSNRIPLVRSFADIGKKHSDPLLLERNGEILCTRISFSSIFSIIGEKFLKIQLFKSPKCQRRRWMVKVSKVLKTLYFLKRCSSPPHGETEIWVLMTVLTWLAWLGVRINTTP